MTSMHTGIFRASSASTEDGRLLMFGGEVGDTSGSRTDLLLSYDTSQPSPSWQKLYGGTLDVNPATDLPGSRMGVCINRLLVCVKCTRGECACAFVCACIYVLWLLTHALIFYHACAYSVFCLGLRLVCWQQVLYLWWSRYDWLSYLIITIDFIFLVCEFVCGV